MTELKRDPAYILSNLVTTDSGEVICKKDCKIQVPVHFEAKNLLDIGLRNFVMGSFPIIIDDKYGVMSMAAKVEISPNVKIVKEKIKGVEYYNMSFAAGEKFIVSSDIFKNDGLMYYLVDEIFMQAKVPWYIIYNDLGQILITAKEYAGSKLMPIDEIGELLASIMARDKKDRRLYYRVTDKKEPPDFIGITSVFYGATNTVNKLCGNYFSEGVVSALINPTEEVEKIESILRA